MFCILSYLKFIFSYLIENYVSQVPLQYHCLMSFYILPIFRDTYIRMLPRPIELVDESCLQVTTIYLKFFLTNHCTQRSTMIHDNVIYDVCVFLFPLISSKSTSELSNYNSLPLFGISSLIKT